MGLGGVAQLAGDDPRAHERLGQLFHQFGVVALVTQQAGVVALLSLEPLVVLQGKLEQPPAQGLHPRLVEQLLLADLGAERVDGLQGMLEIGLGFAALASEALRAATACPPLPGDAAEAHDDGQSQGRQQAGDGGIAPGPLPGALQRADGAGPDRPVGQEPSQVVGQLLGVRGSAGPGRARSPSGRSSPGRAGSRGRARAAAAAPRW